MRKAAGPKFAVMLALIGAPLLTACGGQAHPGAAATLDGDRITVAQLQSRVGDVREAQRSAPSSAELIGQTGRLNLSTLNLMLLERVVDRAAEDAGVDASRSEIEQTRSGMEQQAGGAEEFAAVALEQGGLAPSQIDGYVRMQVLVQKIAQGTGAEPGSPQAQAALNAKLEKASQELDIDVNPRYGQWDATKFELSAVKNDWIKQVTRDPEPAQAPQQ